MSINVFVINCAMVDQVMSQRKLAELSGVSTQSICNTLGRGTCRPEVAGKIAKALGLKPEQILARE